MSALKKKRQVVVLYDRFLEVMKKKERDPELAIESKAPKGKSKNRTILEIAGVMILIGVGAAFITGTAQEAITNNFVMGKEKTAIETVEEKIAKVEKNINTMMGTNNANTEESYKTVLGKNGKNGINGLDGIDGQPGSDGVNGISGLNGTDGQPGKDGAAGVAGQSGLDGQSGTDGINGKNGINGTVGKEGINGKDGINGNIGMSGKDGVMGKDGAVGKDGVAGKDGERGKDGLDGLNGIAGKSAYTAAVEAGYTGTEVEFAAFMSSAPAKLTGVETDLGTLNNNLTTSVTKLNESLTSTNTKVDECFTSVSSGKTLLAATLTDKKVPTAATDTFPVINDNINKLATNNYNNGFIDGQTSVMDKLQVTYVKHSHTGNASLGGGCFTKEMIHKHTGTAVSGGGCYGEAHWSHVHQDNICYDYRTVCGRCKDPDSRWITENGGSAKCNKCGAQWGGTTIQFWHCPGTDNTVNYTLNCGHEDSELTGYECTCGYSQGQIISATITY